MALALALCLTAGACASASEDGELAEIVSQGEGNTPADSGGDGDNDTSSGDGATDSSAGDAADSGSDCSKGSTVEADNGSRDEALALGGAATGQIDPGGQEYWRVELCTGDLIFLQGADQCVGDGQLEWQLLDPTGQVITGYGDLLGISGPFSGACGGNGGPIEIVSSGVHTITVGYSDPMSSAEEYGFTLLEIPQSDPHEIALPQVISPDQPAVGAGRIVTPGARGAYSLELRGGDTILVEPGDQCSGDGDLHWNLLDPNGASLGGRGDLLGLSGPFTGPCGGSATEINIVSTGIHVFDFGYPDRSDGLADAYSVSISLR